jgi:hypothetical protein
MQSAFGTLIWVVVGVGVLGAVVSLLASRGAYDEIGRGGLSIGDEEQRSGDWARRGGGMPASGGTSAERDAEIRQFLNARNQRRLARGQEPIDVDAELSRLLAPAVDDELRDEVRQLVIARNERRAARGKAPLDVEEEVERQLRALSE